MGFTTESARWMLRHRAGKANARIQKERGFPYLVKARAALARKRLAQLALLVDSDCCEHCSIKLRISRLK